jgi:outer membrane protein
MHSSKRVFTGLVIGSIAATLFIASCDNKKGSTTATTDSKTTTTTPAAAGTTPSGKIAYVNMDTLESKYEYLKTKKAELEKETMQLDGEIGRMTQTLQNEYVAFQKKAQAGTVTQAEGDAAQKRLGAMQQNIESRKQTLGAQLMKKQEAFNKDLQSRLDAYLAKYNAEKNYDYIMSYTKGGTIMFANKSLDITEDVVKGMNAEAGSLPAAPAEEKK